jgi:exonuclease III
MAFRKKIKILDELNPDIAIIQECENEEVLKRKKTNLSYDKFIWYGKNKNKGLGVMAFNGFDIELMDHNEGFEYILPIRVHKDRTEFILLAVWTQLVNKNIYDSYVVQATRAFIFYNNLLKKENVLIIGDFNSNAIWDNGAPKEYNHSQMVVTLAKKNFVSVYHTKYKEDHGKEKIPTLYFTRNKNKPYHVDYFFIKESLLGSVKKFSIGNYEKYINLSDHMPLLLEI